jgi:hypothetical protein
MRFPLVARRLILAPALALTLAAAVAACSSSSSSTTSTPPSSSATTSPASATSTASAAAEITANWEKFFDASTPNAQRVALLENGSTFATAITDFSKIPLASGISAKVTAVTVTSATQAAVTYNIVSGSTTLLPGEKGTSVYQDGTWKVGDGSLCGLFKLIPGGTVPAACSSDT